MRILLVSIIFCSRARPVGQSVSFFWFKFVCFLCVWRLLSFFSLCGVLHEPTITSDIFFFPSPAFFFSFFLLSKFTTKPSSSFFLTSRRLLTFFFRVSFYLDIPPLFTFLVFRLLSYYMPSSLSANTLYYYSLLFFFSFLVFFSSLF
jgi:hypothetical protein